ncbi:MAG TPA: PilN domain-containing protein [Candidatus Nitrosocosmicus sp.]|nr:PilN domain-containing protein [Candidatus Nitrosocosmicus sp.]
MKKININLLPKREQSLINRVIYFGLHYLRYIIVITQIVVISVFFYRFKIDQRIIDLKESVEQKEEIFKITQPLIDDARYIEKRSTFISKVLADQTNFYEDSQFIFSNIPTEIILDSFDINSESIKLTGVSNSINRIRHLSERISKGKQYRDVKISKVEKEITGYSFIITIIR